MDMHTPLRDAMTRNGITSISELSRHCGLSLPVCRNADKNIQSIKFVDLEDIFKSLGYVLIVAKVQEAAEV